MCGASGEQQELQKEQMDFYKEAQTEAEKTFSEQQGIIQQLQNVYSPILARGPNAKGFSQAEEQELTAGAVEGTAQNYARAAKAANEAIAAAGGGNIPGLTGSQMQLKAEVAAASAAQQSQEESQILEANYNEGAKEFSQATGALATASGQLSPEAYLHGATEAGSAAESTARDIAEENNSWINAAIGAAGGIAGSVIDMNPKGIFD